MRFESVRRDVGLGPSVRSSSSSKKKVLVVVVVLVIAAATAAPAVLVVGMQTIVDVVAQIL